MNQLERAREAINDIDKQLAGLFEQRMGAVEDVIAYKKANGLEILDAGREKEVVRRGVSLLERQELAPYYADFMAGLMAISRRYQSRLLCRDLVGYQGVEGAFSDIASRKLFPHGRCVSFPTFEAVFEALEEDRIAYGVIPFENSFTGDVGNVLELLRSHPGCTITDVYDQEIVQNLLVLPGTDLAQVREVYSHPQALAQSREFLESHGLRQMPYADTALAAKFVSEAGDRTKAAIAAVSAAQLYGLEVAAAGINTSAENTTRFVVISKFLPVEGNRFSLLFSVRHEAGSLAKAMEIIARCGFSLESIKSRPMHGAPWQYFFYVEVIGSLKTPEGEALLEEMKQMCTELRVLGIYNRD